MGKHKKLKITLAVLCLLLIITIPICYYLVYISYNNLTVNSYNIKSEKIDLDTSSDLSPSSTSKEKSPSLKIVLIGDLHDNTFKDNDDKLVQTIKSQNPDFIIADGDILNDDSQNSDIAMNFIKRLVKIAPVYYALGNHELEYMQNKKSEKLLDEIKATGATLLEQQYKDIKIKGVPIRIGGMYGYAFDPNGTTKKADMGDGIYDFLNEFENTSSYKIMMSHRPDSFIFGEASKAWDIDLVVSSHDHGGQVVFPFLGGFYGGDQGYFPKYIHGLYNKDKMKILVSSGLGSNKQKLPRFNNIPEVMVVNLSK